MSRIFSVEDDKDIQDLLKFSLSGFGHEITVFDNAERLMQSMDGKNKPDLILLDIMLPGMDGIETLKQLKNGRYKNIPVIMLTAKSTEMNIVAGLELGADDYVTKPFSIIELSARINANLRKAKKEDKIEIGNILIDTASHEVYIDGHIIALTVKEFELLYALLSSPNTVLKRDDLLSSIWGYEYLGETRTLDMHIKTLRTKIKGAAGTIETVRGIGFKFCPEE